MIPLNLLFNYLMCVCWCDETLSTSSFFVSSSFYPHFLAASIFSARLSLLQRLLEVYLSIPFSFLFLFPVCFLSTHWIPLHSVERDLCPKLSHLHTPMRCHMIIIAFRISFRKSLLFSFLLLLFPILLYTSYYLGSATDAPMRFIKRGPIAGWSVFGDVVGDLRTVAQMAALFRRHRFLLLLYIFPDS